MGRANLCGAVPIANSRSRWPRYDCLFKKPEPIFKNPWKNPSKEHNERSLSLRSASRAGSSCSYSLPGAAGRLTNGGKNVIWFAAPLPISAAVMLDPQP